MLLAAVKHCDALLENTETSTITIIIILAPNADESLITIIFKLHLFSNPLQNYFLACCPIQTVLYAPELHQIVAIVDPKTICQLIQFVSAFGCHSRGLVYPFSQKIPVKFLPLMTNAEFVDVTTTEHQKMYHLGGWI